MEDAATAEISRASIWQWIKNRATLSNGETMTAEGGVDQTHAVMTRLGEIQQELGASFQDAIKKEGYYFGTTMEEWAAMAALRATYFREPAAVATVVPCHALWPDGALTKVEVLGMRDHWNGFDKYIPREDRWPRRVWDWPIPVPYRQGIRLRNMIWTGGQVPWEPNTNTGRAMHPGDVVAQTRFVMSYIEDILRQLLDGCTDYERLLPDVWKQSHPEAIRVYRQEERRDKADRKQYNAARRRKLRRQLLS